MSSQCQPRNVRSDRIVGRDEPETARAIANTYMSISGDLDARGFELLLLLRLVAVTREAAEDARPAFGVVCALAREDEGVYRKRKALTL